MMRSRKNLTKVLEGDRVNSQFSGLVVRPDEIKRSERGGA